MSNKTFGRETVTDGPMEIKWSKMSELAINRFKETTDGSGIYFARWSRDGDPVSVPRLGGSDHKGLLYIGSGKNLRNRVKIGTTVEESKERLEHSTPS